MTTKSLEKRKLILEKAERVFIRRGFHDVTMKDIIDECKISRGGIYLYYNSVDGIFMDVIQTHNASKLERIRAGAKENAAGFETLLRDYFAMQKDRLLHMDESLFRAMVEFYFSHGERLDGSFFFRQFDNTRNMIEEILRVGVGEGKIDSEKVGALSDMILFEVEGLRTLAITGGLTPELLDTQFELMMRLIL